MKYRHVDVQGEFFWTLQAHAASFWTPLSSIKAKALPYFILTFITVGGMARNLAETETAGAPMRAASIPSELQRESPSVTFISSSFLTISTTHVIL